jgi:hypothetical protein
LLNEVAEERFMEIEADREKQCVGHLQRVKDGTDLAVFFDRVVARVTGDFSSDRDSKGLPQSSDPAISVPPCVYVVEVVKHMKSAIEEFGPRLSPRV